MAKKLLILLLVPCWFLSVILGLLLFTDNNTVGAELVWSDFAYLNDPSSGIVATTGAWSYSGSGETSSYSGKASTTLQSAVSAFTHLNLYSSGNDAIESMTNYKLKFYTKKPSASTAPYYPRIIVGAKSTSNTPSQGSFVVDIKGNAIEINQFGNTKWNASSLNTINWTVLVPGGISTGTLFLFEIDVTPDKIEIFINNVSRYSVLKSSIPDTFDEVGLLGLGATNVNTTNGVSFDQIMFSSLIDTTPTPPQSVPLSSNVTSDGANKFKVNVKGLATGDLFQVWLLNTITIESTIFDYDASTVGTTYWSLIKFYNDTEGLVLETDGSTSFAYEVPAACISGDGSYKLQIKVLSDTLDIILYDKKTICTILDNVVISKATVNDELVNDSYYLDRDALTGNTVSIKVFCDSALPVGDLVMYHFMRSGIPSGGDDAVPQGFMTLQDSSNSSYSLSIPTSGGIYFMRIKAYSLNNPTQNYDEISFRISIPASNMGVISINSSSIGTNSIMHVGDFFAINLAGKTSGNGLYPKYKFHVGEDLKSPFMNQQYSQFSNFSQQINGAGVFLVQSYVSNGAYSDYDDGILKWVRVLRKSIGAVTGGASFSSIDVRVNNGDVISSSVFDSLNSGGASGGGDGGDGSSSGSGSGSGTGASPISVNSGTNDLLSGNFSFNQTSGSTGYIINTGDSITFDANGTGLMNRDSDLSSTYSPATSSDYEYSFYRLDYNCYREIKSWSTDSTLSWKPVAPGNYSIVVRIKGIDALSYEDQKVYKFSVGGAMNMPVVSFTTDKNSYVDSNTTSPAIAREPVLITASCTPAASSVSGSGKNTPASSVTGASCGEYIYRFEVWDEFLGTITLSGFSASNTATWIPRKSGTYRIIVRAQDSSSMGFGDGVCMSSSFIVG